MKIDIENLELDVEIRMHYNKGQTWGDYSVISFWINGCLVDQFGDYYHDKGCVRAEQVVSTLRSLGFKINLQETEFYDIPEYDTEPELPNECTYIEAIYSDYSINNEN